MSSEKQYIDLYRECSELLRQGSPDAMNAVRSDALARFEQLGFPTRKQERWKYTDMGDLFAPDYGLNLKRLHVSADDSEVFRCDVPNLSTRLVMVVNDDPQPAPTFGATFGQFTEQGVFVGSLRQAAALRPELLNKYYAHACDATSEKASATAALNTALAQDGLFVFVPKGVHLDKPLQVVNVLRSQVPLMVVRRVLIVLEEQAEATILFCDHAMDPTEFLSSQVVEIFCGDGANLDLYDLEETHTRCRRVSDTVAEVGQGSTLSINTMTIFNGRTRNTVDVRMRGEQASVTLNGCVVADKRQHVDNNTVIDHQAPHGTSRELFKYVADEQATGAFAGRVLVREEAQHTDSQETNANLCASPTAHVFTQPMLEIYADDVKCAHGSTVGKLDEAALFYMRQRGIDLPEARMLLKVAFVGQVIDQVQLQPLRDRLHYLIEKRFRGELNKCAGCALCK